MSDDADWLDSETVIGYAKLLEEGDEVIIGHSSRTLKNPVQVREVEVTDWDSFTTARIVLNHGTKRFYANDHIVTATTGETARWSQGDYNKPLHEFDPADYDESDLATLEFGDRIESAVSDGGGVVDAAPQVPVEPKPPVSSQRPLSARVPCEGCGGSVTKAYARVFAPERDPESVECCPDCEDLVRGRDGRARENKHLAAGDE